MLIYFLQIFFILCIASSCTPLRFIFSKSTSAKGVIFQAPPKPYQRIDKKNWDVFWNHPKNQNSISFFSNCSNSVAFTSLSQLKQEILNDLKNFVVVLKKKQNHQSQPAYYLQIKETNHASAQKKLYMEMLIFKKQICFYVLNLLVQDSESMTKARTIFRQFIQEFRAP